MIVGAGLAGACAALVLSRTRDVTIIEAEAPASGASGAAAGLANPFMGRKAAPAWRHAEALDALAELCHEAGVPLRTTGLLRPATNPAQARLFADRAHEHAELAWLSRPASAERWPQVHAPHGALWVSTGASVDIPCLVHAALATAASRGALIVRARVRRLETRRAITDSGSIDASRLVLALGDGVRQMAATAGLPLHRVKGQTLLVGRPSALDADHPPVAGTGYVVPSDAHVTVGATFDHAFETTEPDLARDAELQDRARGLLPCLDGAAVLDRRAGVRVTVPATVSPRRLPLAGALDAAGRVVVLAGFGAKGLMTAPLVARRLPDALDGVAALPAELWPPV